MRHFLLYLIVVFLMGSCHSGPTSLFELKPPEETGVAFRNDLTFDEKFNIYTYRNFYNGGGVAIGDINNDGLVDIYFTANQLKNKLYLNKGNFQFEDISERSGTQGSRAWSTGVTMADVNGDGLLDIYVCNSGDIAGDNKQNELFINNGDLTFSEEAEKYGLANRGFSTHASFFDYDKDGDLDIYLLNNSYQSIASFNLRKNERPRRDSLGGDKLMRNEHGHFVDVSEQAGIYGSIIGFGLGVTVGDVNGDTWDDIYVSNDFFERDYLYVNQQNGTFRECLTEQMKSISGASMGADMADVNNDGLNDIFVTEMLPSDEERLKSVTTFEDWARYQYSVENGYYHQFTRNTFQLNNGDSSFSEIGRLAGVEASDWSWGALLFDMDNDGLRDLFIANGIFQDLTDQDYLQYASSEEVVKSIVTNNEVDYEKLIALIPSNPVENHSYKNLGNLKFERKTQEHGLNSKGFSNGSAYGDLDNDGDLDLVVNNVNMEAFIYENILEEINPSAHFLKIVLKGTAPNTFAVGAKVKIASSAVQLYGESQPVRGFQSGMDPRLNFGLPSGEPLTVSITWPTGKTSTLENVPVDQILIVEEQTAPAATGLVKPETKKHLFKKVGNISGYKHQENTFIDFDRDRLLYHFSSTEGPLMASADVNADGHLDFYTGGAKDFSGMLLLGSTTGYQLSPQPAFDKDKISEDAGSVFFDADGDGDADLYVCSGGVEFSQESTALLDRLYFNDGLGNFSKSSQLLPLSSQYFSTSTVAVSDTDGDGDYDLFVGERAKPLHYGAACRGFILTNDGSGNFTDATATQAPYLKNMGMITSAKFSDIDGDADEDLVVVGEFMGVTILENTRGKFEIVSAPVLSSLKGWWRAISATDLDGDGDQDMVVANHGLNSRFKATESQPITLYVDDFDKNGFPDPILTRILDGKGVPYALRHNLIDQMKGLKKLYPDYKSYKGVSIDKVFDPNTLAGATTLTVNTLETLILENLGGYTFRIVHLPLEAQFSPAYAILCHDFDRDGDADILLGGNLFGVKPEMGRYDASFGTYLENTGNLSFKYCRQGCGFKVEGEVRDFLLAGDKVIVSRNSDSLVLFQY